MNGPPDLVDFEYREVLGAGGFSAVYLYDQLRPRRPVAVKVMNAEGLTEEGIRQFEAEADVMAALSAHPSIVTIYTSGIAPDGRPYLVMEYYPGPNLRVRSLHEPMTVAEVLRVGVTVASAVETAHRAGILHRDIKPANILTSQYGRAGLTDFGISVRLNEMTEATGVSIPWAPPEAFEPGSVLDARSDVYSLGATLYTLLTGASPFERKDPSMTDAHLIDRIRMEAVPVTGRPDVPPMLERLLALTMAKSPALRPSSALELARALQEIEIEMRLQPTAIDVLDDLARAAHDLVPSTMRVIGPKVVPIDVNPPSEPLPPVTDGPRAPMVAGDEHTILRPMPEASAPSPAPEREPTDAIEKTVLASSLTGGTARRESPEPARRKGLWLAVVGVLLLALLGGGTAFALRGGPAAEPSASEPPTSEPPTSEPPTSKPPAPPPPPVPVYAVKVEYPESRIPTKEYDNGLEWEVDVCWGRPKGLTRDQAKTHYSQSALYKRVDGKWKNTRSPVLLKEDGRCTGPGEVNQIVAATAATPDEATAGKGWSACQDYLLVVPASELGSVSTARTTQPICVRTSLTMEPQP